MSAYSHADFETNPKKYEIYRTAIIKNNVFTHNGDHDIKAGTVVAIEYRCTARNQLYRRSEPVYHIKGYGMDMYANNLMNFIL